MKKFKELEGILLVDDDRPTNFIHTKVIEKSNVNVPVKAITNVVEALEFLTQSGAYEGTPTTFRPGIIFLDINMPGLNGWDFMEKYDKLEDRYKARIVVIMLTTSLNPDDERRAANDKNIATFLHKPLRPETVEQLVNSYFVPAE